MNKLGNVRPALATLAVALAFTSLPSLAVPAWVQAGPAGTAGCPTAVERMLNFTKDGIVQKGEVIGDRLMLVGKDGKMAPAVDGTYLMPNGQKVVVKEGKIAAHGTGGGGGAGKS